MTLTEAAFWTRRFGVIIVGVIAILILVVVVLLNLSTDNGTIPEYLNPNFACTNTKEEFLKYKLDIPSLELAQGSIKQFSLETETGKADQLTRIVNVYAYDDAGQSLNSQNEAKNIAENLGFDPTKMVRQGTTSYNWSLPEGARTLQINSTDLNFVMKTDFTKSKAYPLDGVLPTDEEAKTKATAILRNSGLLSSDYASQKPSVVMIKIEQDGSFSQAKAKVDADLIRVDFERRRSIIAFPSSVTGAKSMKDILENERFVSTVEKRSVNGSNLEYYTFSALLIPTSVVKSNISVYVGPTNKNVKDSDVSNIYQIEYNNFYIADEPCGTYELIQRSEALQIVQNGGGSLVYLNEKNGDTVVPYSQRKVTKFTIYQIQLKYYDPSVFTKYLQPVYIVYGEATFDNGLLGEFYYYVPAINYDQVGNKVVTKTATTTTSTN
jgi:hypothetical protein